MAKEESIGVEQSREILADRVRAWWMSAIIGQANGSHPVRGTDIAARVEDGALIISGHVSSDAERREVEAEVEHLKGEAFSRVQNELQIDEHTSEEQGLLSQTIMAVFETEEQAGFAEGFLETHAGVHHQRMQVIGPSTPDGAERLRSMLPKDHREDATGAIEAGRVLLLATVDETEAFQAREILDEETQSLETIALPPRATDRAAVAADAADHGAALGTGTELPGKAEDARQKALQAEAAIHDD